MGEDIEERSPYLLTEDNVTIVKKLVKQDQYLTGKQLSSKTGISVRSIELILQHHLNMNKLSARSVPVPRLLTSGQRSRGLSPSKLFFEWSQTTHIYLKI